MVEAACNARFVASVRSQELTLPHHRPRLRNCRLRLRNHRPRLQNRRLRPRIDLVFRHVRDQAVDLPPRASERRGDPHRGVPSAASG